MKRDGKTYERWVLRRHGAVLDYLGRVGEATTTDIAEACGLARNTGQQLIKFCYERRLIQRTRRPRARGRVTAMYSLPGYVSDREDAKVETSGAPTAIPVRQICHQCPYTHLVSSIEECRYRVDSVEGCALEMAKEKEHTLEEVGNVLGVTRERVRQIEEAALQKLWRACRANPGVYDELLASIREREDACASREMASAWSPGEDSKRRRKRDQRIGVAAKVKRDAERILTRPKAVAALRALRDSDGMTVSAIAEVSGLSQPQVFQDIIPIFAMKSGKKKSTKNYRSNAYILRYEYRDLPELMSDTESGLPRLAFQE